jgi:hypothetical protein
VPAEEEAPEELEELEGGDSGESFRGEVPDNHEQGLNEVPMQVD